MSLEKQVYLLLLILLMPLNLVSQKNKDKNRQKIEKEGKEYFDRIFEKEDLMFQVSECPEVYKESSSVVLALKTHVAFLRNPTSGFNMTKVAMRKRILLNDEAAVKEYSEFYYQNSEVVGIVHVKKDETEVELDLTNAVAVISDIPEFYEDRFHNEDYFKIAIADLKKGDILDFYKVFKQSYQTFVELQIPLVSSIPIIQQEYVFDVDKKWTLYYDGYNGADDFVIDPEGGFDMRGRKRKIVKRLMINHKNSDASVHERWTHKFLHIPHIKLMAVPPNNDKFSDKKGLVKGMSFEKMLKESLEDPFGFYHGYFIKYLEDIIEESHLDKIELSESIDFLYKSIRPRVLKLNREKAFIKYSKKANYYSDYMDKYERINEFNGYNGNSFVDIFAKALKKLDVDVEIIMAMPRYYGPLENLVTTGEVVFGFYVKEIDRFYWPLTEYSTSADVPNYVQGAKAIKLAFSKIYNEQAELEKLEIPVTTPTENLYNNKLHIILDENLVSNIKVESSMTGDYRKIYSPIFLSNTDYLEGESIYTMTDEMRLEKEEKDRDEQEKMTSNPSKRYLKKQAKKVAEIDEMKRKNEESISDWISNEFEITKLVTHELVSAGMMTPEDGLKLNYNFTSDDYVKKAGPNLIFDIGRLLGDQIQLTDEEISSRKEDANMRNPRSIKNQIIIELPEGLKARGLEKLSYNVENKHGGFVSSAVQEGNIITLVTSKTYKTTNVPVAEWSDIVAFLEASYKFTQTKVILKEKD